LERAEAREVSVGDSANVDVPRVHFLARDQVDQEFPPRGLDDEREQVDLLRGFASSFARRAERRAARRLGVSFAFSFVVVFLERRVHREFTVRNP
jgi:hypothetical protein